MTTINDKTEAAIRTLIISVLDRDLGTDAKTALYLLRSEFLTNNKLEVTDKISEIDFDIALADWLKKAQAIVDVGYADSPNTNPVLSISRGRRYAKIVRKDECGGHSVHCFIDTRNGDVLKAASWKAPAKGARGNIYTDAMGVTAHGGVYNR